MDQKPTDPLHEDLPLPESAQPITPPPADDDGSWGFLPLILGLAALCLALFFFLSPPPDADRQTTAKTEQGQSQPTPKQ